MYKRQVFRPTIDIDRQLGLKQLEAEPIEFVLENTDIWNLLDKGSPPHSIQPRKFGGTLQFIGWGQPDSPGYTSFKEKALGSVTYTTRVHTRTGIYNREVTRIRDTGLSGRLKKASRGPDSTLEGRTYPPTYLASTRPNIFTSYRPRNLGDTLVVIKPSPAKHTCLLYTSPSPRD